MEGSSVQRIFSLIADKILAGARVGSGDDFLQILGHHMRLLSTSEVDGSEGVSTCDFTGNEEIFFPETPGALPNVVAPIAQGVDRNLGGLVDPEAVNIKHGDGETGEMLDPLSHGWHPFSQAILDGGEFRQLTLPVRVDTKGFCVSILVVMRSASNRVETGTVRDDFPVLNDEKSIPDRSRYCSIQPSCL